MIALHCQFAAVKYDNRRPIYDFLFRGNNNVCPMCLCLRNISVGTFQMVSNRLFDLRMVIKLTRYSVIDYVIWRSFVLPTIWLKDGGSISIHFRFRVVHQRVTHTNADIHTDTQTPTISKATMTFRLKAVILSKFINYNLQRFLD